MILDRLNNGGRLKTNIEYKSIVEKRNNYNEQSSLFKELYDERKTCKS